MTSQQKTRLATKLSIMGHLEWEHEKRRQAEERPGRWLAWTLESRFASAKKLPEKLFCRSTSNGDEALRRIWAVFHIRGIPPSRRKSRSRASFGQSRDGTRTKKLRSEIISRCLGRAFRQRLPKPSNHTLSRTMTIAVITMTDGDVICSAGVRLPTKGPCLICGARHPAMCMKANALYRQARQLVEQQAEDDGLWFIAQTAPEAYLQQELRKLHKIIEGQDDG